MQDATAVPDVIAATLGVQQRLGSTVTDRLVEYLRTKNLLLVLDNCEHVLAGTRDLAAVLLHACPELTVMATRMLPNSASVLANDMPLPPPVLFAAPERITITLSRR